MFVVGHLLVVEYIYIVVLLFFTSVKIKVFLSPLIQAHSAVAPHPSSVKRISCQIL